MLALSKDTASQPLLCSGTSPLVNGNFEAGSCNPDNSCSFHAFNTNGTCGNLNWIGNQIGASIGNYTPFSPTYNICSFDDCDFTPGSLANVTGIHLKSTEGILINNCHFTGLGGDAVTGTDYTASIIGCDFNGHIPVAVRVQHSPSLIQTLDFFVSDCDFFNTNTNSGLLNLSNGIMATGVSDLEVYGNNFRNSGIGTNIVGTSGFRIEGNDYNVANLNNNELFGILLNQTGNDLNSSLCNRFGNISLAGTGVWSDNVGYEFKWENYLNGTHADINMYSFTTQNASVSHQGAPGNPRYNLFTNNTDIVSSTAGGTDQFRYFYPGLHAITFPMLWPQCDLNDGLSNCTLGNPINNFDAISAITSEDNPDGCLNLDGIGTEGLGPQIPLPDGKSMDAPTTPDIPGMGSLPGLPLFPNMSCATEACLPTIRAKIAELEALMDGNDKAGLLAALQSAPAATATQHALNSASPYLSDEVLLALLANLGVPTGTKQDLLLANGPVSATVLAAAQGQVSAATIQQLNDQRTNLGVSSREQLEILIPDLYRLKHRATYANVQRLQLLGNAATIAAVLAADGTDWANRLLVGSKLRNGDFTGAQSVLDALPSATASDAAYKFTQQINLYHLQDEEFELSETQEEDLYEIADGETPEASYAKALLTILTGVVFPPEMPEELEERMGNENESEINFNHGTQPSIMLRPNPANDELLITIPAQFIDGSLDIYDINGKLVLSNVPSKATTALSVRGLANGFYLVRASCLGHSIHAKLVVQN